MQNTQAEPIIVTIVPGSPAAETTVADVIIGAVGITGALVLLALTLGVVFAGLRIRWIRRHPPSDDHLPPVAPDMPDPAPSPSSRVRPTS